METSMNMAYVAIDRHGHATVMVSKEYQDASRPGWSRSVTQDFKRAKDLEHARSIAAKLKETGQVDLVKEL